MFKVLVFIMGLNDDKDKNKNIRTCLLNLQDRTKTEDVKLQKMIEEAERIPPIEKDSGIGNSHDVVQAVRQSHYNKSNHHPAKSPSSFDHQKKIPRTPCWQCGALHYVKDCQYTERMCPKCNVKGHKENYCEAQGNRKKFNGKQQNNNNNHHGKQVRVVSSDVYNGTADATPADRKFITVFVNNTKVIFQYDTASDVTLISEDT